MNINTSIDQINNRLDRIEENQRMMSDKLDIIIKILENDVKINCEKMSNHINFVDTVYDNVKHPLGFLCNKLNILSSDQDTKYTLEEPKL